MTATAQVQNSFTFVKGLISEASPLTFPADASLDENNFILKRDGSREKRLGFNYEADFTILDDSVPSGQYEDGVITTGVWESVDNDAQRSFLVCQIGNTLRFHDISGTTDPISGSRKTFTVDLGPFAIGNPTLVYLERIQFSSGKGFFFVTSSALNPFYVKYDADTDTISTVEITINVRDFDGVEDSLDTDVRPSSLTDLHKYNLVNQGWGETKTLKQGDVVGIDYDHMKTDLGVYPSNADIAYLGMVLDTVQVENQFDPAEIESKYFGNTPAAQGKQILNYLNKDRSTVSGVANIPIETETSGPMTSEFFAGRFFTAFKDDVLYTQVVKDEDDLQKFHQDADPTSEITNEIVSTDGGVIHIQGAGTIFKLLEVATGILVLASNGIWFINGADSSFTATNFQVSHVSDRGIQSAEGVVRVEDTLFYVNDSGIYSISLDDISGRPKAVNVTKSTIQTIFQTISSASRENMLGIYDFAEKRVYWLYNSDPSYTGATYRSRYDSILVLDMVLGAWSKISTTQLATNSPYIYSAFITPETRRVDDSIDVVTTGGDTVTDIAGNQLVIDGVGTREVETITLNFLTALEKDSDPLTYVYTFSQLNSFNLLDWESADDTGIGYEAFLLTGYNTGDDVMRFKQSPIIQAVFERTEGLFVDNGSGGVEFDRPSSCLLETRWDWSDSNITGKVTDAQELYRFTRPFVAGGIGEVFDNGYPVVTTRTKVRGRGRAMNMKFTSPAGKDCKLLGWATLLTGVKIP